MKRLATILSLLLALPLAAQEAPQFGERVDVNLVLLDAIVTDSRGNQILGLDKTDFVVKENGVEQTIDSLDYFTNRRLLNAQEGSAPFKVERVREDRYFVFFFDKPLPESNLYNELGHARAAAKRFIQKELMPGDLVAVVGHDVRLKVYSDFTADKRQLNKALDEVMRFGTGLNKFPGGEGPSILRTLETNNTGTVYEALDALGESLRPIRARKNVILFSPGIHEPGEIVRNGMVLNPSRYFEPMIQSLNSANVAVYAINLQRNASGFPAVHQSLERLTMETNGDYWRHAVSFDPLLDRIESANNGYYLIGYYTKRREPGYQRVEVSVRNQPQLRVKAREGYAYGAE